ncbi:MAG: DUF523 domain-containing protein [Erysipelotrichaceae bacterium]|nr:DUF523 domain-containing protein [Erysipelotrichaceae bacterium]
MKIAVSACLLGYNVRYNGTNKKNDRLLELIKDMDIIPICPESSAKLKIPRDPIEIKDGRIIDPSGNDYTDILSVADKKVYERIKECDFLILKTKSPSCGYGYIYDGNFNGTLIEGNGSFTQYCLDKGMKIYTEENLEEIEKEIKAL